MIASEVRALYLGSETTMTSQSTSSAAYVCTQVPRGCWMGGNTKITDLGGKKPVIPLLVGVAFGANGANFVRPRDYASATKKASQPCSAATTSTPSRSTSPG